MPIFTLPPYANQNENTPYVTWSKVITNEEIDKIIEIGDKFPSDEAGVVGMDGDTIQKQEIRKSETSWIPCLPEYHWLYSKIGTILRKVNGDFYRFDITGMYESMQYTTYHSSNLGFYEWHLDNGVYSEISITRKLSMSILLTDPSEFEGGDLQVWGCKGQNTVPKEIGIVTVFPSYTLHRVTPVTKGIRKSLVVWFGGPAFR